MSTPQGGRRPGSQIGPYQILARIGNGGMGEVYRARDPRLRRDVALKLLPEELATDRGRLKRFQQEAQTVSALSHPNIVTVFEIGEADGVPYIAMELVEGLTLRQSLRPGGLPLRKLLDLAVQIAEGLSRAHEAGIVHRDLKPENVMVTPDGIVKILDFGLAKLTRSPLERGAGPDEGTLPLPTRPGVLLGTVRYMSPEQAAGMPADFRADQFSFASVLYEMATGQSPFQKSTTVDTLSAILHEEPAPIAQANPKVPRPLRWILERCLAKDPKERYDSTRDLARDLVAVREHLSEVSGSEEVLRLPAAVAIRRPWAWGLAAAVLAAVGMLAGVAAGPHLARAAPPVFRQLTFRSGAVWSAFFAPDEATVLYTASWEGRPLEIFVQRIGSPESRRLEMPGGLFGVSRSGEMARSLDQRGFQPWIDIGTLARMEMASGAAPREVMRDVQWAAWSPDGKDFAIIHESGGRSTLEYPIGSVLYKGAGFLSHPRISPDGDRVAFLDHPVRADDAGAVAVVDRRGRKKGLAEGLLSVFGLAWSPSGDEVWFTGTATGTNRSLEAVNLSGRHRTLARVIGSMQLDDVCPSGKVLLTHDERKEHIVGLAPGESKERELSWLDYSLARAISRDGTQVLFVEGGEGAGSSYAVFLRGTDGSPAVRLGDGDAQALSADGKWALAIVRQADRLQLAVYPTGAGLSRVLPVVGLDLQRADLLPDGTQILMTAAQAGHGTRLYLQDVSGSPPKPVSPEGYSALPGTISPDGTQVVARGPEDRLVLLPLRGGPPVPLRPSVAGAEPCGWTSDGAHLYAAIRSRSRQAALVPSGPVPVGILDVKTGEVSPWKTLGSEDGASSIRVTPDGRAYVYSFVHTQGDLFLVEGVR